MDLGSVSGVWMNGRPSGLPEDIDDQLAEARYKKRVTPLEEDKSEKQELKESYTKLDETLVSFMQQAENMSSTDTFTNRLASSSNEAVATVEADKDSSTGVSSLVVNSLATAHNMLVGIEESDGILDADDEALISDDAELSFEHLGETFSYQTSENTSLRDLAQAIDEDDNGVQATVTQQGPTDDPGYVLQLKSEETGAGEKEITNIQANGLYAGETTQTSQAQAGSNASFTLDGVDFTWASNTVDGLVDGMKFELHAAGSSQISVQEDLESIATGIQQFVDSYNSTQDFIQESTKYDAEDDTAGRLNGDFMVRNLDTRMSRTIIEPVSGSGDNTFQYLSEIGISFNREGKLELDGEKMQQALTTDAAGVEKLFAGEKGVAEKLTQTLSGYTDDRDGILTYSMQSLDSKIERLDDRIQDEQQSVQRYLSNTVKQFTAMENAITKYQSVQDQLDSYIETWSQMNGSKK